MNPRHDEKLKGQQDNGEDSNGNNTGFTVQEDAVLQDSNSQKNIPHGQRLRLQLHEAFDLTVV